ncbi:MAG TPA: hypothetical protein VII28_17510 [Puia sp.]
MKILSVVLCLLGFFFSQSSFAQDTTIINKPDPAVQMQDTSIFMEPAFVVRNRYAARDSIMAYRFWASKMRDTTIEIDPAFIVLNEYHERDSIDALYGGFASRRDSLVHAFNDSLSAIGNALLHTADMQDTTIELNPAFIVSEVYAGKDRLDSAKSEARAVLVRAAAMQDTTVNMDPSFLIIERYANKDRYDAFRDSVWAMLAQAAVMQDTTILMDPRFIVRKEYAAKDKLAATLDSLAWPTIMRDTIVNQDPSFVIQDLYPRKDYRDSARESQLAFADSVYSDSVNRHWAGWKNYEVQPHYNYLLNAQKILKGRTKSNLQYNIADFYLYLNGDPVKPDKSEDIFFAAACLAFKYDDTLLLNSGLGLKMGIGVGIKIIQGKFISSLHANRHNEEIYKENEDDSVYKKNIVLDPNTQSLKLQFEPSYQSDEIITGEYQADYKKFYQKNEGGQDEARQYTVRIIFRCRVTGGLDTIKSLR